MRIRTLFAIALMAALCFGGSFTCNGSTHDDNKKSGRARELPRTFVIAAGASQWGS